MAPPDPRTFHPQRFEQIAKKAFHHIALVYRTFLALRCVNLGLVRWPPPAGGFRPEWPKRPAGAGRAVFEASLGESPAFRARGDTRST